MLLSKIKISNFLSIESAEIEFQESGLYLLDGWNYDMARANAAGKTSICNAISFCLYGKIPRKITASDILRTGAKSGFVELELESAGTIYKVKRERPNKVTFWQDDVELPLSQEAFEAKIQIRYDQFLAVMYFAQGYSGRFIGLNDSEKKEFLLKLLNLDSFTTYKQTADEELKTLDKQKTLLNSKINEINTKIQVYKESIIDPENNIRDLQVLDKAIKKCSSEIDMLLGIPKPDQQEFRTEDARLTLLLQEGVGASAKKPLMLQEHRRLSSQLEALNKAPSHLSCPKCSSGVVISGGKLISVGEPVDCSGEKQALLEQIQAIKLSIESMDQSISNSDVIKNQQRNLYSQQQAELASYNAVQTKIQEYRSQIAKFTNKSQSLTDKLNQQAELNTKILDQEAHLNAQKVALDAVLSKSDLFSAVSSIFSSTGAQAYVLDSTVDALNTYIKANIAEIWNNISYSFLTTKENSKGEVMAKFSEELIMEGEEKALGSLSGGEYRALSIAIDFAIVDLLSNFLGIRISPIILDEPFDSLDVVGKETVVELLEKMAVHRQIFVIDHSSEIKAAFTNVLRIEKRAGISSIV